MIIALVHRVGSEGLLTPETVVGRRRCNKLPVDSSPFDFLDVPHVEHKLVEVPLGIDCVKVLSVAVCVDELSGRWALLPLALGLGEKGVAVCAPV